MNTHFLLIGDASGRRLNGFVECFKKLGTSSYQVITWQEYFDDFLVFSRKLRENTIVRLEPPEKDMEIYRAILKLGEVDNRLSNAEIDDIDFSQFPIIAPGQWYAGFTKLITDIAQTCSVHADKKILMMQDHCEALAMMDKRQTYDRLAAKAKEYSYYLPAKLEAPLRVKEFREMYGGQVLKCFIKLRYGSGGTGILAYKNNPRLNEETLWTSLKVEIRGGKKFFYSGRKIAFITDKAKIGELIEWVLANGAHIETWIPKAAYQGTHFDTRVLVAAKTPQYFITRLSKTPITNLHLGNQRRNSSEVFTAGQLAVLSQAAADVMKVFNKSLYAGIDIVCSPGYKPYVIDVNPFGDLFHNLLGTEANVYYYEIKAALEKMREIQ
ncbi:MAG: glutathione synthase/ribosomal protein S6modification protein [Firmicutes bacterium]|nr:glutathione synthase/ribosomal protein S6modification protein [Bacillota bacterium]